jgi:hypothetical protein
MSTLASYLVILPQRGQLENNVRMAEMNAFNDERIPSTTLGCAALRSQGGHRVILDAQHNSRFVDAQCASNPCPTRI